ncbi:MAG TPA: toll/interleukin-1 receptor domain-containing protein [Tepidiformaceae bacterium]|nr:toll/interleukin-1 receptor domain-containing protein [Tepidiformaceae bacterium]
MTQPDPSLPKELFLSHADRDRAVADRLSAELTRHGVPHWFSRRELVGAQQWHDEIGEALERCDWFAVLLSPRSVASMWVKREVLFALGDPKFERRIVPILAEDCSTRQLSWALDQHQRVDLRTTWESGMRDLLRVWGLGYRG